MTANTYPIIPSNKYEIELHKKYAWARQLTQFDEISKDYWWFFEPLQKAGEPFPFTVEVPPFNKFQEKLVCICGQDLVVLDKNDVSASSLTFAKKNISDIELRMVLLDSSLHISGIDHNGEFVTFSLRFNSVSLKLIKLLAQKIRQASFSNLAAVDDFSFSNLETASFKFAYFCRQCILPGEKVTGLVWQPQYRVNMRGKEVTSPKNSIFTRLVFSNHAVMLTDQELILVEEDKHFSRKDNYTGIWKFISLDKIDSLSINSSEDGHLVFSVNLLDGRTLDSLYLFSKQSELENLINSIRIERMKRKYKITNN